MYRLVSHPIRSFVRVAVWFVLGVVVAWPPVSYADSNREYLDAGEIAGITAGSAAVLVMGSLAEHSAKGDSARWSSPFLFEGSLQRTLGGSYYPGKTNFLDGTTGSAYTAIGGLAILVSADLAWASDDAGSIAAEDLFLYVTGIAATKGITSLAKGLVRRKRPMVVLEPELASQRRTIDNGFDNRSFFSGHTSSAFFASAFLNLRLRAIMRHELNASDYRNWRWAPPTLLFSWASVVGWSRIHTYKHFFLDVVAGAVAGTLVAELFYSFQKDGTPLINNPEGTSSRVLQIQIRF